MSVLELDQYIAPDGAVYDLQDRERHFVMSTTGEGMPPLEYQTQRAPYQHGDTVLDFRLRPRVLQMVYREQACTREEYWRSRGGAGGHVFRTIPITSASASLNELTTSVEHHQSIGDEVYITVLTGLGGLSTGRYYVTYTTPSTFAVSATPGGSWVNILADGTGLLRGNARRDIIGLLDAIRPNRQIDGTIRPGRLRKLLPDGSKRDLYVHITAGPGFAARSVAQWDELAFTEALRFTAYDPVWFDPTDKTEFVDVSGGCNLRVPICVPLAFGGNWTGRVNVMYDGTWPDYPVLKLFGPFTRVLIKNTISNSLGGIPQSWTLDLTYPVGYESVIIDLTPGSKTAIKSGGVNLMPYFATDSDIADWRLEPHPRAEFGRNEIDVIFLGGDNASTAAFVQYHNRFLGI